MKKTIQTLVSCLVLLNSCMELPEFNNPYDSKDLDPIDLGNANFTKYVAIGGEITAGYQSSSLYQSAQIYSYPNLISKQVLTNFEMPLISDPGLGGRLELQSMNPIVIYSNPEKGVLLNSNYALPFNNLAVPGAYLYDILYATNSTSCASFLFLGTPNIYFDVVLRNELINIGTILQQSFAVSPTFITLWIGNNDILGYAISGGVSPAAPTNVATFVQLYAGISQQLAASGAQVVVANIPGVTHLPFFTTVGPIVASSTSWSQLAALGITGIVYEKSTIPGIGSADSASLQNGAALITLAGSSYVSILGDTTGKYYSISGSPIPVDVDITKPFGFHTQNPWPNSLILDPDEISIVENTVNSFNAVIQSAANNYHFGLVDIHSRFNQFKQNDINGTIINGITFRTNFVTGGLFSLDGVHPSSRAQGIIANEFIKVINTKFNAAIPLIDVALIP